MKRFHILFMIQSLFSNLFISKALDGDGYPTSPESTNVPARANDTQANSIASFEEYNNSEIEVISIARGRTPFLHTLIGIGRGLNGGNYAALGVNEKVSTNFPEYKWKERDEFNDIFTINGALLSTATTLVFDSTSGLYAGLLLRNTSTNEQIRISSVTNTTDVVVQRGVGTVTAAAIGDNDVFIVLSSAASKGQSSSNSFFVANIDRSNYFQKFLTTASIEDFDVLSYKIDGGENMIAEKTVQHALEQENAAIFGQKSSGIDKDGKPYYTMEGVIENCKRGWTNDISGSFSRSTLEEALIAPLKYTKDGSYTKIVLCGSKVRGVISEEFENRLQVNQIKDIDLTFNSLQINQGKFIFVEHPMLDETSGYAGTMFVIDPSFLKIVYPSGTNPIDGSKLSGKTRMIVNQANKTFAYCEFSLVSYMTMENTNSNAMGAIKVA